MIIVAYGNNAYKEYLLPNLKNTEYSVMIDHDIFQLKQDLELRLEVDGRGWRFMKSGGYTLKKREQDQEEYIGQGDIYSLTTERNETLQLIAADFQPGVLVMDKFDLSGTYQITIGNHESNTICYDFQRLVSGEHGYIERRADGFYIQDTSANGIFCGGRKIQGRKRLRFGDCINIFGLQLIYLDQMLAIGTNYGKLKIRTEELLPFPQEEWKAGNVSEKAETVYFNRSPRNLPVIASEKVEIEGPPTPKQKSKKPLFLTIGPAFTMAIPMLLGCSMAILSSRLTGRSSGVFMFTGIITAVSSAVLGVFWGMMNVKYSGKEREEEETQRFNAYGNYLLDVSQKLRDMYNQNDRALHQMYPSAQECCTYSENSPQLWNRNFSHRDFLWQRLGLGDIPFQAEIAVPKEGFSLLDDSLSKKPGMIKEEYQTLHSVPVGIDLSRKHLIGLVGGKNKKGALSLMHILTAQIAANNCYTDVKLVYVYDKRKEKDTAGWECMKWLPHVWSEDKHTRYFAADPLEAGDIFFELANVFRRREEMPQSNRKSTRIKPHYILFIADPSILEGELIRKYIYEPKDIYGASVFLMTETCEQLPNVCEDIIQYDSFFQGCYNVMENTEERQRINFDGIRPAWLEEFGRRILKLKVNEIESNAEIPSSLSFLEMYHVHNLAELHVEERWRKNRTYNSMRALIGQKAGNADCYLDVHEKYHGPHGLVAGTTGSGKSETLQTYILSLAINFSPDDIAFFIIDYKGGGMANLFSDLPHLAGQISNLSGNQVRRAMISIKSENMRRQKVFGEYGVNNINNYTRLYKEQEAAFPIPHLFIIIDEFAELKREEPEFMRELISVAQVGRSLGVHLILATQKPSGTVDDNIWSNSKFRLCLRVQDRQDSNDMLHKPDAAFITQAGRCYLQVGNDEIYELFQSGYSGAPYEGEGAAVREDGALLLTNTGKPAVVGGRKRRKAISDSGAREITQLEAVVKYLNHMAKEQGYDHRLQLWLPVLKREIYLEELNGYVPFDEKNPWPVPQGKWELSALVGMCDDPVNQAQMPLEVSFSENGHHAVCGTIVSGKSTFVQTLLWSLTNKYSPAYLNIYALDYSSRMLAPFEKLPHTGGVIYEGEEERVGKLFHLLNGVMEERKKLFRGGNYNQYVQAYGVKLPAILLVVDNYANFKEKTGNAFEENFIRIAREGVGYGLYLLMTSAGFGLSEIPSRIGDNIRTVLSLEMGDQFKYMDVLRTTHISVFPEQDVKGRGLAFYKGDLLEFQTALSLRAEDDFARSRKLEALCEKMNACWKQRPARPIPQIPENPTLELLAGLEDYGKENQQGRKLPFAYGLEDASVYSVSLMGTFCYTIQGRSRTGKTNVLRLLLYAGTREAQNASCVVVEMKTQQLKSAAEEWGAGYITTAKGLFDYFTELTPVFKARNKKKWELLNQGYTEEKVFEEQAKEQPVYIFLADLSEFVKTLYTKHENMGSMAGFAENIFEKGSLHNIYFFGCLNTEECTSLAGYRAYTLFTGYKKGVHLGGNLSAQRNFSFQNIPYGELGKVLKKGIGYVPDEEDNTLAKKIVIPLAGR